MKLRLDCIHVNREKRWLKQVGGWTISLVTFSLGLALVEDWHAHASKVLRVRVREVSKKSFSIPILSLDASARSSLAAAALAGCRVSVFRVDTGEVIRDFEVWKGGVRQDEPARVRFSPDGSRLGASCFNRIYLYDTGTWEVLGTLGIKEEDQSPEPVLARRYPSPEEPPRELPSQVPRVSDFAFTPDGRFVIASYCRVDCNVMLPFWLDLHSEAGGDDPVRLWELRTELLVWERQYEPTQVIARVVPSPDGTRFAAATTLRGSHFIHLHDLQTGDRLYSLPPFYFHPSVDPPVFFEPSSQTLITVSTVPYTRNNRSNRHLALYDSTSGKMLREFRSECGAGSGDISPDGRLFASRCWFTTGFQVWDRQTGMPLAKIHPGKGILGRWHRVPSLFRFDPDGRWLIVADGITGRLVVYEYSVEP